MRRENLLLCSILVSMVCATAFLLALAGCGGGGSITPPPPPPQKIQHVVIIFQENRTPDNLFHGLPNADIANSGVNSLGQIIPLTPISLANDYDLSHAHSAFVAMYDGGKMDGADKIPIGCQAGAIGCPPPNPQFQYVNPAEVQPYFQLAQTYTFGDRMFQTNQGPSFPAHQFIIAGTSAPSPTSNLFASENVLLPLNAGTNNAAGCAGPAGETVAMIDPTGSEAMRQFPCFEHPTLTDLLDASGITWRYYAPSPGSIWTGPNAIQHMRFGPAWQKVIIPQTNVLTDIANGQLAQVTWVIPDGRASDHALSNDGSGPSWVASIVNAIGNSPYWANTAIFITWDDWGGWYDHVAPTIQNSYEYGFRVPLIVVSPYAKRAYVSHVTHDFGSLLKFIESTFKLASLGFADSPADDLSDCFDFTQTPPPFQVIPAKLAASHFLADTRPPVDPDDD
jgi:phospholipase C